MSNSCKQEEVSRADFEAIQARELAKPIVKRVTCFWCKYFDWEEESTEVLHANKFHDKIRIPVLYGQCRRYPNSVAAHQAYWCGEHVYSERHADLLKSIVDDDDFTNTTP